MSIDEQTGRQIREQSKMIALTRKIWTSIAATASAAAMVFMIGVTVPPAARADEAAARTLLKAMSDYLTAQKAMSFSYDANLEVVTGDVQKLMLAASGTVILNRPDKIRATRSAGFADVEMVYDGKTVTLLGKLQKLYTEISVANTIDKLFDELREKYNFSLPAADLLMSNAYDLLIADVTDIKDLGSAVIGGVECDHLAFRTRDTDWQIWIAHGARPYPCKYVITSKLVTGMPQYSIQVRDWKAGSDVAQDDFKLKMPADAKKVELKDVPGIGEIPTHFTTGGR